MHVALWAPDAIARWLAGDLSSAPLSDDDRERLGRGARIEELAEVLRSLAT